MQFIYHLFLSKQFFEASRYSSVGQHLWRSEKNIFKGSSRGRSIKAFHIIGYCSICIRFHFFSTNDNFNTKEVYSYTSSYTYLRIVKAFHKKLSNNISFSLYLSVKLHSFYISRNKMFFQNLTKNGWFFLGKLHK